MPEQRPPSGAEQFRAGAPDRREALRPTSRFRRVFAAVGNSELKALVTLWIESGYSSTASELAEDISIGGKSILENKDIQGFMSSSLIPAEIVSRRKTVVEGISQHTYTKTDTDGLGTQVAEQMLALSERHPGFSLQDLWGPASVSRGEANSSPLVRLEILKTMADSRTPLSTSKLQERLGDPTLQLHNHLRALEEADVLTYEIVTVDTTEPQFVLAATPVPPDQGSHATEAAETEGFREERLLNIVRGLLNDVDVQGVISASTVRAELIQQVSEYADIDQQQLTDRLSQVLLELESRGVTEETRSPQDSFARISLKGNQVDVCKDIVGTVRAIESQDQEALAAGKAQADAILRRPQRIESLANKARSRSTSRRKPRRRGPSDEELATLREQISARWGRPNEEIARELGIPLRRFERLVQRFRDEGAETDFPDKSGGRDSMIRRVARRQPDMSASDLAARFGISPAEVETILNPPRPEPPGAPQTEYEGLNVDTVRALYLAGYKTPEIAAILESDPMDVAAARNQIPFAEQKEMGLLHGTGRPPTSEEDRLTVLDELGFSREEAAERILRMQEEGFHVSPTRRTPRHGTRHEDDSPTPPESGEVSPATIFQQTAEVRLPMEQTVFTPGDTDPFAKDPDVPLAQRDATRRATSESRDRTKRQGK